MGRALAPAAPPGRVVMPETVLMGDGLLATVVAVLAGFVDVAAGVCVRAGGVWVFTGGVLVGVGVEVEVDVDVLVGVCVAVFVGVWVLGSAVWVTPTVRVTTTVVDASGDTVRSGSGVSVACG